MSRRRVEKLKPFGFRADFAAGPVQAAPETDAETVEIAPEDLAALGARLYADAARDAQGRLDADAARRLDDAIARMDQAVGALHELTNALDRLGQGGVLPGHLAALSDRAARSLIDGQGDLFAVKEGLCLASDEGHRTQRTDVT